jgi:Protein of unknown function (DUF3995)
MNDSAQLSIVRVRPQRIRALWWALTWAVLFTAVHAYWYLGGRIGFGDTPSPLPGRPASLSAWILTITVALMFAIGLAVPIELLRDTGHGVLRRLLVASLWIGCLLLLARGTLGLVDEAVRRLGISSLGIIGLSYRDILGTAHPSTCTLISGDLIDGDFFLGGILYGWAARSCKLG